MGAIPIPVRRISMINRNLAVQAVRDLLEALGQDLEKEGLKDTPTRVADLYIEQCTVSDPELHRVFEEEHYDEMIMVRDIPFSSFCEHHMLPYWGKAHVAYVPREKILGISKLARLIYSESRGFTIQERITKSVADQLHNELKPEGCMVVLEAQHGCINFRGARAMGSSTVTSAVRGLYRDSQATRHEALSLMLGRGT